jgi:tRNA(Ile)-lysidine synthase TilS/MesJ
MSKIDTTPSNWLAGELKKAILDAPTVEDRVFRHYAFCRALERNDNGAELRELIECVADGRLFKPGKPNNSVSRERSELAPRTVWQS